MIQSIRKGFTRLAVFSGRDHAGQFWPFAALAVVLSLTVVGPIWIAEFNRAFDQIEQYALANPDQVMVRSGAGSYEIQVEGGSPNMLPDLERLVPLDVGQHGVLVALLAAAVTRRLHDAGRSGLWGLMPLPFIATSLTLSPRLFEGPISGAPSAQSPQLFLLTFLSNLLYLISFAALFLLLLGSSTPGANRFGPPSI